MTTEEFNLEFDTLYNNISSNQAPGLNTYEKSIFLTKAQEEILKNYFNPKGNKYQEGFEDTAKRQIDFSNLIRYGKLEKCLSPGILGDYYPDHLFFYYNSDNKDKILISLDEKLEIGDNTLRVIPISYKEYQRLISKPLKYPSKDTAWRILVNTEIDSKETTIYDIIINPKYNTSESVLSYYIRFIKRPNPIIIENLIGDYIGLTIDGLSTKTECELDPLIHREILVRAVELAKIAFSSEENLLQIGQRTE